MVFDTDGGPHDRVAPMRTHQAVSSITLNKRSHTMSGRKFTIGTFVIGTTTSGSLVVAA